MYLQQEQFNVLTSLKSECKKREGSFILTRNNKWIYKDVEVDFLGFCAKKDNNPVDLKPKEIKLLELLIKHKNQVLTRNQMLDSLWEIDEAPADRVIDVYIKNIRKKLGIDCIITVKGIGYKFEEKL